jgi:hypothetical protein
MITKRPSYVTTPRHTSRTAAAAVRGALPRLSEPCRPASQAENGPAFEDWKPCRLSWLGRVHAGRPFITAYIQGPLLTTLAYIQGRPYIHGPLLTTFAYIQGPSPALHGVAATSRARSTELARARSWLA